MVALSTNAAFIDALAVECWTRAGIDQQIAQRIIDAWRRSIEARDALIEHMKAIGDCPTAAELETKRELAERLERATHALIEAQAPVKAQMEEAVRQRGGAIQLAHPQPWP